MEKTLVIIKPDAIQRGLIGTIISRFEAKGLKLVAMKLEQLTQELLNEHYAHIIDKPFFPSNSEFMKSTPVILQIWEGIEVAKTIRSMTGVTNCREALSGTIRGDLAMSIERNVIHSSEDVAAAQIEIERFFTVAEIFDYPKLTEQYSYANDERA